MRRAEIVGGGMAGMTVAAALARRGWQVRLREAAPTLRGYGGGLYMTADGLAAAADIGLAERLRAASFAPLSYDTLVDGDLRIRDENDGTFRTALRGDLHALLVAAAREADVTLIAGAPVTRVDPSGRIGMADGGEAEAELVVVAEGTACTLPQQLGLAPQRTRFDDGLVRVLLDRSALEGKEWERARDFWAYGERRLRILYTPCSATHCYFVMMAPSTEPGTDGLPVRPEIWLPSFPELAPILPAAAAAARFDLYGSIRLERWSAGRVAILGDAAHAMPSSIGKGANLAMRSAVALAEAVTEGSLEHGLAAWEAAMRPVVDSAQELAERIVGERALSGGAPAQAYDTPIVHRVLAQSQ